MNQPSIGVTCGQQGLLSLRQSQVHPYLGSAEVLPEDYLDVIRQDAEVPGEVEQVVRDVLLAMTDFAAYRRPSARAALQCLELNGSQ